MGAGMSSKCNKQKRSGSVASCIIEYRTLASATISSSTKMSMTKSRMVEQGSSVVAARRMASVQCPREPTSAITHMHAACKATSASHKSHDPHYSQCLEHPPSATLCTGLPSAFHTFLLTFWSMWAVGRKNFGNVAPCLGVTFWQVGLLWGPEHSSSTGATVSHSLRLVLVLIVPSALFCSFMLQNTAPWCPLTCRHLRASHAAQPTSMRFTQRVHNTTLLQELISALGTP